MNATVLSEKTKRERDECSLPEENKARGRSAEGKGKTGYLETGNAFLFFQPTNVAT
jgi:hypothetical protein